MDRVLVGSEVVDLRLDLQGEVLVNGEGVGAIPNLERNRFGRVRDSKDFQTVYLLPNESMTMK